MARSVDEKGGLCNSQDVVSKATERLRSVPSLAALNVSCEFEGGVLILRGTVQSFFEKQLAQEAVLKLDGVDSVANEIAVVESCRGSDITARYR
jgi:osmotically-inducible protein OsmY